MPWSLVFALLLTPPGTPAGGFRYQRIITPPPAAPTEQACVVLDAATFANAAPSLRDLRLFQDGTELPYVIEESYDERALNSGVTPDDDRSEYETVVAGRVPAGASAVRLALPPHVPVERIVAERASGLRDLLAVRATDTHLNDSEQVDVALAPGQTAAALTLGANLQHAAEVLIQLAGATSSPQTFTLQMRKRSLCYQPRSASPLVLYLGGGQGIAAKTYGLANGFSVSANRPYATMGPLEPNPDLHQDARHPVSRLLIAIAVLGGTLLLTLWIGLELLRKEKGRPKAA